MQDRHKDIAKDVEINDRVFFYELKGTGKLNICHQDYETGTGKMGIVHIGKVTGSPYSRSQAQGQSKSFGDVSKYWSIGIPTDAGNSSGFIAKDKVVAILGYKNNYFFKGFAGGTGIKQIDDSQAIELLALY